MPRPRRSTLHFLKKYPQNPLLADVTMRRAAALAELKQYADAAALYASVSAKWPKSKLAAPADLAGGKCYYLAGDPAAARKLLDPIVTGGGESAAEAAHWLVRILSKEGKPAEALAMLEKLLPTLDDRARSAQLMMDRADAALRHSREARRSGTPLCVDCRTIPRRPCRPPSPVHGRFHGPRQRRFRRRALKHAAAFLAAYPDHRCAAEVLYIAAESQLQLGQLEVAEKQFAELLEKFPHHADAESWKVRRGLSLYLQKKYAETADLLKPMLPDLHGADALAEAHYLLGGSQVELKQPAAAVKSLEASLAAQPKWRQADDVLLVLAQAHSDLKNTSRPTRP